MEWLGFWGSILGGAIGGLFTYFGVKLTLAHDDEKKQKEALEKAIEERPRLEVVDYKEVGKHRNTKSDLDAICLPIKEVNKKGDHLEFVYDDRALDKNRLVTCEYVLRNTGATEIDSICLVSGAHRDTAFIELRNVDWLVNGHLLNYSAWADKRFIKSGDQLTIRIYYVEDSVVYLPISASVEVYMHDINGRYWRQPLFCPTNEIDNSTLTTRKEMKSESEIDIAIKCFEGKIPW